MSGLFKNLGKGVLYVIGFPFVIAGIVLTGAIGIFIFLFQLIKIIILFFQGRSIFQPLDEDIKAQAINQSMIIRFIQLVVLKLPHLHL